MMYISIISIIALCFISVAIGALYREVYAERLASSIERWSAYVLIAGIYVSFVVGTIWIEAEVNPIENNPKFKKGDWVEIDSSGVIGEIDEIYYHLVKPDTIIYQDKLNGR